MFDSVVLRRAAGGTPVTPGQIAEAMLFYQRVHLVLDRQTIFDLVAKIGVADVLVLVSRPELRSVYCEEMIGVMTDTPTGFPMHSFANLCFQGTQDEFLPDDPASRLAFEISRKGIERSDAKRFANALLRRVPSRKFSGNHFISGGLAEAARKSVLDQAFLTLAANEVVRHLDLSTRPLERPIRFDLLETPHGFSIFHDIDFDELNARRALSNPPLEPATVAMVLSHIQAGNSDLILAAHYGGDFWTSSIGSSVIQIKHRELLQRTSANADSRESFHESLLPDVPNVREAIDSGVRTFPEFLRLLDKAARFKEWLHGVHPDEGLVHNYVRDVKSEGWLQRTPGRSMRFFLTSGIGMAGMATGLAASFIDTFLIEKLMGGWRPSHFVDERLAPFVSGR
jgi:hypothetical protein